MQSDSSSDTDPSLYILNENNKWITEKYIINLLAKYGVKIKVNDIDLFRRATIHTSYLQQNVEEYKKSTHKRSNSDLEPISDPDTAIPLQERSYERLEFLGDAVLHLILADYIWTRYENEFEGFMTRLRTKIENSDTLAELANAIGLNEYILISRFMDMNDARNKNQHIQEDMFEAFLGALYKNSGYEVCRDFFYNLMEEKVDFAEILHTETNFKDLLLQYFHKMRWADPIYGSVDVSGPEHAKVFYMYVKWKKTVRDDGQIVGYGHGSSKRKGEQEAARQALIHFGEIRDVTDSDSDTCETLPDDDIH